MRKKLWAILLTVILGLMLTNPLSQALSAQDAKINRERTFNFDVQNGQFRYTHTLYVTVPNSLYEYYNNRNHLVSNDNDYAKYATPSIFASIAENIQKVTNSTPFPEEQFANAVLSMVRQINYTKSSVKYPVEAIVENSGDCDVLSLLAASIMQAGGLDVVLFHYKNLNPSHMNIGVYLPYKPVYRPWWTTPIGFEYKNKTYWIAETTSLGQWKVGERPELLAYSNVYIIPLINSQKSAPGQIASSLDRPLLPSAISITLSSDNSNLDKSKHTLTVSGTITPAIQNSTITMYITQSKSTQALKTKTNQSGNYSFKANITTTSTYQIQTSWSGIQNFTGADSEILTVFGSHRPIIADSEQEYYVYSNPNLAGFGAFLSQSGKEFLKGNVSGTGALLSGEFIVLDDNQTDKLSEPTILYDVEQIVGFSRGRVPIKITIPEVVLPPIIPNGQFGFILSQNGDNNYSASVRILEDKDVSQIATQLDEEGTAFMNASKITKENTWYRITASISPSASNAALYEENGTPVNNVAPRNDSSTANQIGVLLEYNPGAVIVFRNLKVETLDKTESPPINPQTFENSEQNAFFIGLVPGLIAILIVATATIALVRRRRKRK